MALVMSPSATVFELPCSNPKAVRHDVAMQEKTRLLQERGLDKWFDWSRPDRPAVPDFLQRTGTAACRWASHCTTRLRCVSKATSSNAERAARCACPRWTVDSSGRLRVVDPVAMQQALFGGIGHATAFGCGLLLVRPVS